MSEYQTDYDLLKSSHTIDKSQSETKDTFHIADNRSLSQTQKIVQKKLAQFEHIQSSNVLQRKDPLEDEELPGKNGSETGVSQLESDTTKPNRTGIPDNLKSGIENLSGVSLDDVQVHYNSDKPTQLQALAYTQGTDIHVAPGQEKHLPHEAWHVVQQMQGRVEPTLKMNDNIPVNDDAGLEHEADIMGGKA